MSSDSKETRPSEEAEPTAMRAPSRPIVGESGKRSIQGQGLRESAGDTKPPSDQPEKRVIGNPEHDAKFCHEQERCDTCAIASQRGIIEKHSGHDPGEKALSQEAEKRGWYVSEGDDAGTPIACVGNLLDSHDVPTTRWNSASMDTLRDELENGHDVIAGVDAGFLWQNADHIGEGHAVWVTGLETDETGKANGVFLNDTGNPEIGGGGRVSTETFEQAWTRMGNPMVSTQESASLSREAEKDNGI